LAADFVAWQENICLVPGHPALQTNKVKHRKVAALRTQTHSVRYIDIIIIILITRGISFAANLQREDLQGVLHQGGRVENDGLGDEGRLDGSRVEQVRVVADFTELHEDVDHRHEVTAGQRFPGPVNRRGETKLLIQTIK